MDYKTAEIKIRVAPRVKAKLMHLANEYAEGNLSAWMEYGGLHVRRKALKTGTSPRRPAPAKNPDEETGISSRKCSRR